MIALIIFVFSIALVLGVGVLAAWSDIKGMVIPNAHSLIVAGAFFVCYALMALLGRDVFMGFSSHFLAGVLVFVISAAMFFFGIMGAADSKLSSAYALWLGLPGLVPFLFYMSLMGGVLALAAIVIGKKKPFKSPPKDSWADRVQRGESKVPYGVAIVFGVFVSFAFLGYFSYGTFVSILNYTS